MVTLDGDIVTFEVSLLTSAMVAPPKGAPVTRLTGNGTDWPGPTVTFESSVMAPSMATVTLAEPVLYPGAPARMVVEPMTAPVAVNVPVVAPAANATVAGWKVTNPAGSVSVTDTPPVGAGLLSVRVPLTVRVSPMIPADSATVTAGDVTLTWANPGVNPLASAVMVVLPDPLPGMTCTLTPAKPSGTVTFAWMDAIVPLLLSRKTIWPPGPAKLPRDTVRNPGVLVLKLKGFGERVIVLPPAVTVTVAGVLYANPSNTINCTTYVPATSAKNVGETAVSDESAAVLPAGRLLNDQAYVSGSPSASDEPEPSSDTLEGAGTN